MPVRLSSTLDQLLVCPIATPSPMSVQREGNLSGPEEEGIAEALEFEFWSSNMKEFSFYLMIIMYCFLVFWNNLLILVFIFPYLREKIETLSPNNFVLAHFSED